MFQYQDRVCQWLSVWRGLYLTEFCEPQATPTQSNPFCLVHCLPCPLLLRHGEVQHPTCVSSHLGVSCSALSPSSHTKSSPPYVRRDDRMQKPLIEDVGLAQSYPKRTYSVSPNSEKALELLVLNADRNTWLRKWTPWERTFILSKSAY